MAVAHSCYLLCLSANRLSTCDVRQITPPRIVSAVIWNHPLFHKYLRTQAPHTVLHVWDTWNAFCVVTSWLPPPPPAPLPCRHLTTTGYSYSFSARDVFNAIWLFRKMLCILCLCGPSLRGASRSPVGMCTEWNITLARPLNATWISNCLQKLALEPSLASQISVHPVFSPSPLPERQSYPSLDERGRPSPFWRSTIIVTCGFHF
jgi:hypothetical protein